MSKLDDDFAEFDAARPKSKKEADADLKHALAIVEREGFVVHKPEPAAPVVEFDTSRIRGDRIRISIVSDSHAGSKYQQWSYLHEFYRYATKGRKVDLFIHGCFVVPLLAMTTLGVSVRPDTAWR